MPGSVMSAFSELEDFEAALRADGYVGLLTTGHGPFRARLTQISLHLSCLLAAEESLPRIAFVAIPRDTVSISFQAGSGSVPMFGGIGLRAGEIMTLGPDTHVHVRTDGACHWGAIQISANGLVKYGVALTGAAFSIPPGAQRWRPSAASVRRLRSLHAAAVRMAATRPQALVDPEAAHGVQRQFW